MKVLLRKFLGIVLLVSISPFALAQEAPLGPLTSFTEFTIKPGQSMQFREGIKAWKECYLKNGGEWTWRMWERQQGEGTVFVLASSMPNWAEMDKTDESGKDCQLLAINMINAHVEKAISHTTRLMPEISNNNPFDGKIIRVGFYRTNIENGYKMMETVKEVEEIRKNAGLSIDGYWYNWLTADPDSPSAHYVIGYENYAEMDIQKESVWQSVENAAGKEKRDELQSKFRSTLQNSWSYIYRFDEEISHLGTN